LSTELFALHTILETRLMATMLLSRSVLSD